MGTNAHAANRNVKTLMTTNAPDSNLFNEGDGRSAIDHWVLLDAMQQWPSLPYTGGGDLWSYASCNTGFGTPCMDGGLSADQRTHPSRVLELDARRHGTSVLASGRNGAAGNAIGSWNNVDTTGCGGGMGRPGRWHLRLSSGPIASSESAPGYV